MKSPGYGAAPHEWGWRVGGEAGLIRRRWVARTLMSGRSAAMVKAVAGRGRPAMKSPGYGAAPHEWGWGEGRGSRIDPAPLGSPDIHVRAGVCNGEYVGWRWPPGDEVAGLQSDAP